MVADSRLNAFVEVNDWSLCSVKVGEVDKVIRSQECEMDSRLVQTAAIKRDFLSVISLATLTSVNRLKPNSITLAGSKLVNQIA